MEHVSIDRLLQQPKAILLERFVSATGRERRAPAAQTMGGGTGPKAGLVAGQVMILDPMGNEGVGTQAPLAVLLVL